MKINCKFDSKGIVLSVNEIKYALEFPSEVWMNFPIEHKKIFADNYAFLKSLHLPRFFEDYEKIEYKTSFPLFKSQIYNCMLNNLAFSADVDNASSAEYIKGFLNLEFGFNGYKKDSLPDYKEELQEKAVVAMSFGKDSLLSYGLAKEIGLEPVPIMSVDNDCPVENKYKINISKIFSKETGTKIGLITNNTSLIHRPKYWKIPNTEWGFGHLITEYVFNTMPFAHYLNSKYIVLGNEKSCDDSYINKEGYLSYPVYDQSSEWLLELTKFAKSMTNNQMQVISLIEPLYELAVLKILHNRYPELGKYQMSCFPDENEYGKHHYWCGACSKCARIYILLRANKILPKRIGFKTDMLDMKHKNLYSIFGVEKKEGASVGYDTSGCGRDEQLYAFYLAYKNGAKGKLIDLFKKEHLHEAKEREEEFYKKFYGIHKSKTIPEHILTKLIPIFKEELGK
ncbi:hypothetical protein JXB41_06425 [Candidatus Woesearchaeota archaeon]|nr:hypothetical protein [Candidatus Woesearchaeota archaeon]